MVSASTKDCAAGENLETQCSRLFVSLNAFSFLFAVQLTV
jgi:hypothetical protein